MKIPSLALCAFMTALLASPLLTGCAHRTTVQSSTISVGQQLDDLDKAYKNGSITQKEYEKLKKAIIKKND